MPEIIPNFDQSLAQKIEAPDTSEIKKALEQEIMGQPEAVDFWAGVIHRVMSNAPRLRDGPLAVLTEIGPSGSGKTEIVKKVAIYLASQSYKQGQLAGTKEQATFIRIDCGEYQQEHEVSKIIGSPPGYFGADLTPRLAQSEIDRHAIALTPEKSVTILLLDEIEKAHPKLNVTLLGGLDYGNITLGNNKKTNLKNCIVVFTSNLGNKEISTAQIDKVELTAEEKQRIRHDAMREYFTPEQLSRMGGETNTLVFEELSREVVTKILVGKFGKLEQLYAKQGTQLDFQLTQAGVDKLLELGYSTTEGIRRLENVLDQQVVSKLTNLPKIKSKTSVVVDVSSGELELYIPKQPGVEKKSVTGITTKVVPESEPPKQKLKVGGLQPLENREVNGDAQALWSDYVTFVEQIAGVVARALEKFPPLAPLAQSILEDGKAHKLTYNIERYFKQVVESGYSEISEDEAKNQLQSYINQMSQMLLTHAEQRTDIKSYDRQENIKRIHWYALQAADGKYPDLVDAFKKTFSVG